MRSDDMRRPPRSPLVRPAISSSSLATGTAIALGVTAVGSPVDALPASTYFDPTASAQVATTEARELLVVDARVPHQAMILAATRQGVATLVLDAGRDGLSQIEEAARGRDLEAIHLLAHGEPGVVRLGSTTLDAGTAESRRDTLGRWFVPRQPFEARPELLVYGCQSASGTDGAALLRALADATGADVAGSIDRTGGLQRGADWILEASVGVVDASLPFALTLALAYPAVLETFTVTTSAESGPGSLVQAVADANANGNPGETDDIVFASLTGTITPSVSLTVTEPLRIRGPGAEALAIDGGGAVRIFDATAALALEGLTLANGSASDGGGGALRVDGAALVVDECVLTGNGSTANGGAIAASSASVSITESDFEANYAASGGALFATDSALDVETSSFADNDASADGGAIAIVSSTAFVDDSLFSGNDAAGRGGAIHVADGMGGTPLVSVQNSTISGNSASAGGGLAAADDAYAELVHVTVTENTVSGPASGDCGGAGVDGCDLGGPGIILVESSILAGNLAGSSPGVDLAGDALDLELEVRASLIGLLEGGVATSGEPIFGEDPRLGPLADNGGTTQTHALLDGSPAIDEGENPGALAFDQRGIGFPRVIGAAADMGAYEWSPDDGAGGGGETDGGSGDGGIDSVPKGPGGDDGCGCSVPGGAGGGSIPASGGVLGALLGALGLARRRRRR